MKPATKRVPRFGEYAERVLDSIENGETLNRSGDVYKPSAARSIRKAYRCHLGPWFYGERIDLIDRRRVQSMVDTMRKTNFDPSTIRNAVSALRVIFRSAIRDELVTTCPADSALMMPAVRGVRDEIVDPADAAAMISNLMIAKDRAVWALAFYAGLRRGEILGLINADINLDAGTITISRALDEDGSVIDPKSAAGRRTITMPRLLRDEIEAFSPGVNVASLQARADRAWSEVGLPRTTLHGARHTYAAILIAAGCNVKTVQTMMGHASITTTYDRYGWLLPGGLDEARTLIDKYLEA